MKKTMLSYFFIYLNVSIDENIVGKAQHLN